MHTLLILIVLMLAFPAFAQLVGGMLKKFFWLIVVVLAIGLFGALLH